MLNHAINLKDLWFAACADCGGGSCSCNATHQAAATHQLASIGNSGYNYIYKREALAAAGNTTFSLISKLGSRVFNHASIWYLRSILLVHDLYTPLSAMPMGSHRRCTDSQPADKHQ